MFITLKKNKNGSSLGNANENYFVPITRSIIKKPQKIASVGEDVGNWNPWHYWSELKPVQSPRKFIW